MDKKTMSSEWVSFARRDMAAAEHLQTMYPAPLEIICFHCQQAVEKALKGFLIYHGAASVPRIHDLAALCKLCMEFVPDFGEMLEPCADLTTYAVQMRYPSSMEIEEHHMQWAVSFAKTALNTIFSHMDVEPE